MQPTQTPATANGYTPRYRQFPPQSIVWVQNPFDQDVDFQVADELNRPFVYTLPTHKVSELPGGSIATLGVKKLVDALMQNDPKAAVQIWDLPSRAKFEEKIIMRVKEAPSREEQVTPSGKIDLSVKTTAAEATPELPSASEIITDTAGEFPDLAPLPTPGNINNVTIGAVAAPPAPLPPSQPVAPPPLPVAAPPVAATAPQIDPDALAAVGALPAVGLDSAAGGE